MTKLISPIKYFGGKFYMTKILLNNFPRAYNCYVEVFGGSAALLFAKPITPNEIYNDLELNVYSLFKCLSNEKLFTLLKHRLDLTYYSAQIRENVSNDSINIVDRAYNFFVKNRMSYNGVGGFSRNFIVRRNMGKSVSDFLSAIDRLPEIHQRLSKVLIENSSWREIIKRYNNKNTFMYLDPPYKISTRLSSQKYLLDMTNQEHNDLINTVLNSKAKFLISGYDNPIYDKLENNGFLKINFALPNAKSKAIESIWKNYT